MVAPPNRFAISAKASANAETRIRTIIRRTVILLVSPRRRKSLVTYATSESVRTARTASPDILRLPKGQRYHGHGGPDTISGLPSGSSGLVGPVRFRDLRTFPELPWRFHDTPGFEPGSPHKRKQFQPEPATAFMRDSLRNGRRLHAFYRLGEPWPI